MRTCYFRPASFLAFGRLGPVKFLGLGKITWLVGRQGGIGRRREDAEEEEGYQDQYEGARCKREQEFRDVIIRKRKSAERGKEEGAEAEACQWKRSRCAF